MAATKGEHVVRSGPLEGRVYKSYYQYQNALARYQGYGSYYRLRKAKLTGSYRPPEPTPTQYEKEVRRNIVRQMGGQLRGSASNVFLPSGRTFNFHGTTHELPDWVNMNDIRPGGSFAHYLEEDLGIRERGAPYNVGETPDLSKARAA